MRKRILIEKKKSIRKSLVPEFTVEHIDRFADKVARGQHILLHHHTYVNDTVVKGLKANVFDTGNWSFVVEYKVKREPGRRPYIRIGKPPEMTVERAREIARMILDLKKHPTMTIEKARKIVRSCGFGAQEKIT